MSNTTMTSASTMTEAGSRKRHARQVTFHESQEPDSVDLEAGHPALFQDITAELSDGPAVTPPKSRQNSLDFCIARWKENDAAAEEQDEKAVSEKEEEQATEHLEAVVSEPSKVHARASRCRLSDYLPDFAGDADQNCQEIELGQYPDAVRQGAVREPPPSNVSESEAPESLLDRLVRCFTQ